MSPKIIVHFNKRTHQFTKIEGGDVNDQTIPGNADLHRQIDDLADFLGGIKKTEKSKPVEKQQRHMITRETVSHKR